MNTIERAYSTTTEVNRSKFITHLVPMSEYEGYTTPISQDNFPKFLIHP